MTTPTEERVAVNSGHKRGDLHHKGPFVWECQGDRNGDESWHLQRTGALEKVCPFYYLKNYGGVPGDGSFSGWKFGSGGPYPIGSWHTFEEAVDGCYSYLLETLAEESARRLAEAQQLVVDLAPLIAELNKLKTP